MINFNSIKDKKIAIIGATGFVGGRLFEILKENQISPTIILRHYKNASMLSRYEYEDLICNLNDENQTNEVISNFDICFNCAHDFTADQENMVNAIENLAIACAKNNVNLIHLSSVAVHEPLKDSTIDEKSDICLKSNFYGYTKYLIEKKLLDIKKSMKFNLVILRPTNIYGPFSGAWTIGPCDKLINGKVALTNQSKNSINNLIYVDDVCNYMIKSSFVEIDKNIEPIFLINGPDNNISWSEFYKNYSSILSVNKPIYIDEAQIVKNNKNFLKFLINGIKNVSMLQDNFITAYLISLLKKLPNSMKSKLKIYQKNLSSKLGEIIFYPNNKEILDYKNQSYVSSQKAELHLDYKSIYSYENGLKETSSFIDWYYERSN